MGEEVELCSLDRLCSESLTATGMGTSEEDEYLYAYVTVQQRIAG